MTRFTLIAAAVLASTVSAANTTTGKANSWGLLGSTGASGQQLILGTANTVYIVDKTENNPASINGHPTWATEYDLRTNTYRSLDIKTNAFCAGGSVLGNGTILNVGGNNAVSTAGISDSVLKIAEGAGAYQDYSGGRATRVINPCDNSTCTWSEDIDAMPRNRWYPTLETLEDGSVMIIGGELWGGFVNSVSQMQSVASYEFWPTKGDPVNSTFLQDTQPANLYPLTWLLPSGQIFMQANWQTTLLNYTSGVETRLPNITKAQRTYPAAGAIAMLPLTVSNGYTPTLLFCGGMDPVRDDWNNTLWAIIDTNTSSSCVSINPQDASPTWVDDDDLPENRGMGNFIILPDERLFLSNGAGRGSEGYGFDSWAMNQSYATDPVLTPTIYNASAPKGSRFDTSLPASTIPRLYHSTSTLLPDGSIMVTGSNPNADMIDESNNATYVYKTEYRAEAFYPDYYDAVRPVPTGIPSNVNYGGGYFNLSLPASSLNGTSLDTIKVNLIRTGFSTHAMNMGMRYVELNTTYTGLTGGGATLHVSHLPPNPSILVPGPALLFVVVNGIPSIGQFVMVGSGSLGTQPTALAIELPESIGNQLVTSTAKASTSGVAGSLLDGRARRGVAAAAVVVAAVGLF